MTKISPSVLAADLSNLAAEVADIASAGADMVHLDVMDGMFVTNISFGLPVIQSLRKRSDMIFDVHLMIDAPERYAARFIEAGADILTFHLEACKEPGKLIDEIREEGVMAGISVKPATPIEVCPVPPNGIYPKTLSISARQSPCRRRRGLPICLVVKRIWISTPPLVVPLLVLTILPLSSCPPHTCT